VALPCQHLGGMPGVLGLYIPVVSASISPSGYVEKDVMTI
jgi:hypothetical protein